MNGFSHRVEQVRARGERGLAALPRFLRGFRFGRGLTPPAGHSADVAGEAGRNPLSEYFDGHTEGQGIWKWRHYFDIYHRHFAKFVGTDVHVLEIGVYSGGSLGMWRSYFGDGCTVLGVDVEPACRAYEADGVRVFIGDQADRQFWERFRREAPRVDIVIDDGGHRAEQQVVTLEALLAHIRPGGVYMCEDITGLGNPFHAYLAGLTENLHTGAITGKGTVYTNPLQQRVDSIHHYPFVTVLELSATPRSTLVSERRGTQWEPFLG